MHGNARFAAPAIHRKAVVPAVRNHALAGLHAPCDMAPYSVSSKDFLLFQAMISRESGIWLSEAKAALLPGRLSKRLRALGLRNFPEYYQRVDTDEEERRANRPRQPLRIRVPMNLLPLQGVTERRVHQQSGCGLTTVTPFSSPPPVGQDLDPCRDFQTRGRLQLLPTDRQCDRNSPPTLVAEVTPHGWQQAITLKTRTGYR
ncbi:MAG: hypothetical protein ACLPLR_04145 [Terriglobales bacterium]